MNRIQGIFLALSVSAAAWAGSPQSSGAIACVERDEENAETRITGKLPVGADSVRFDFPAGFPASEIRVSSAGDCPRLRQMIVNGAALEGEGDVGVLEAPTRVRRLEVKWEGAPEGLCEFQITGLVDDSDDYADYQQGITINVYANQYGNGAYPYATGLIPPYSGGYVTPVYPVLPVVQPTFTYYTLPTYTYYTYPTLPVGTVYYGGYGYGFGGSVLLLGR